MEKIHLSPPGFKNDVNNNPHSDKSVLLLNATAISKKLHDPTAIQLDIFKTIDSTNEYLKKDMPSMNALMYSPIHICLTEQQTQGRGRLGRHWHSPFGQNIYFSCRYALKREVTELAGLSLVVSLATLKTLQIYVPNQSLWVKWPNDIVYQSSKLAGCLIEVQAETHGACHVIIGIGINVNMQDNAYDAITQKWTSLHKLTGKLVDRNDVCATLINQLLTDLKRFETQGFETFIEAWNQVDCLFNRALTLTCLDKSIHGIAKGIDTQGHLILQLADGSRKTFSAGDTTIKKKT
jgi:BirA family biotin operon repressor/biotin-[acetyl-CoA-carboxylase] ligase